jgi:hypothetical protein
LTFLKNPSIFQDDFWCRFVMIWISVVAAMLNGAFLFLKGQNLPMAYFMCTGINLPKLFFFADSGANLILVRVEQLPTCSFLWLCS